MCLLVVRFWLTDEVEVFYAYVWTMKNQLNRIPTRKALNPEYRKHKPKRSEVNNFRNSNSKIQYSYLLTPKGIEEKAKLTLDFIRIKTQEYDTLKQEIESLKQEAKNMDRNLL